MWVGVTSMNIKITYRNRETSSTAIAAVAAAAAALFLL
jgi:hypothetical protein